jgi:undecaprenyl-diphosphatase
MDAITAFKAALLGIVEGLTEFIPVSSTGHLIVASELLGFNHPVREVFEIVIQMGAIMAVCWHYRAQLMKTARGLTDDPTAQLLALNLAIAFVPFAVAGLLFHKQLKALLFNPPVVAAALIIGGIAILAVERWKPATRETDGGALSLRTAFLIGLCQILALIPGTSRSGATILGALCLGVSRAAATEFSFYLAIPVLVSASCYDLFKHRHELTSDGLELIAIGFVVSFIVALAVIRWLLRFVASHTFVAFAWYRIAAGVALIAAMALGWLKTSWV